MLSGDSEWNAKPDSPRRSRSILAAPVGTTPLVGIVPAHSVQEGIPGPTQMGREEVATTRTYPLIEKTYPFPPLCIAVRLGTLQFQRILARCGSRDRKAECIKKFGGE